MLPMETTLEKRIEDLEEQVSRLTEQVTGVSERPIKDWRSSVGMLPQDQISEQADRLGREWRETDWEG